MKRAFLKFFFLILSINCFSQNQFRNGTSPTTTRYLFPDQNINGLNHLMYNTEGLDGLNFFGSRLLDIDFDGKIDVVMRAKEHLEGDWDFPSGNPRMYLKGNITNDFNFKFEKKDLLIADGTKVVFDSVSSKKFVFNHTFQDATGVNQIGVKNFDVFYTSKGLVKYEDYNFDDDFFWVTNRIYEVSNGEVKDITRINLVYSDRIKNDVVRFFNAQASVSADIDSDGDLDIILSGRTVAFKVVPPGFTNNYGYNIHNILVFKNLGNGKLFADIMDVSNIGAFVINEGNQLYALNMDDDKELEVLTSISVGSGVVLSPNREFGYIDFNLNDNSVSFKKIFNSTEFLEDPNWTIEPKDIKPLPVKSGRNLLLFYFGKNFGTPVMKLTGKTDFNEGVTQQYFRVYEVLNKNLVNVTQEFFYPNEEKTLSLDNSGYVYFLDVDGDGLIDIFPQLGTSIFPEYGGINYFLKYPSWNGKFNTMYYFKQENTGKFKLTDLIKIDKLNFPQNFKESDFRLFNDYGEYKNSSGNTLRSEAFTMLNQFSLNDIDNDGKFEYLTSWQPDFLSIYTKSKINYSPVSNYNINDSKFVFAQDPVNAWQEYYDYSKIKISKDTAFANLDYAVSQKFIVKDSLKLLTNSPFTYSPQLSNSIYSIDPPTFWNYTKVSDTIHLMGCVVPSNLVDSVGVDFMVPIGLPTNNDVYIKQSKLTYIKKNFAPFPFDVLKEVRLDNSNFRGFEVTISNSVDINLNEYKINDIIYRGPRYGYELFINNVKVKTALLSNNDFSFERINNLTVRKFRIPLEQKSFLNVRYKVFAIDTHNENLKTFAINRICDNSLLPTLKYTKNSFCESDSIKIQISNASSSDRYKWYVGSKIDSSNVLSKYITSTNKIFVIKTDSLDCVTSSDTVSITKLAAVPVPKISNSGSLTFCAGQNVVLTSSETNNLWYLNGNEISNSNSKTLTVTSAGAYSVKSILGECSSQLSSTVTVTVNSIPDTPKITNSTPLTFCTGQSVILTSSGSNNQWYLNTAAISNATSITLTVTASGSYAVKSTISGCSSPLSSAVNVVVNTIPEVPKITNSTPLTFCAGQNVQLTSSGTNNQWYLNGSAIANETSATYIATASGTYTVKAINANCSSPLSTGSVVVVNPIPPTPTITLEANGGLTSSAADGIQWYFNDVKIDNATQKTINPTKSGNYTVKVLTPCASEISKPFNLVVTGTEEAILEQVQLSPNPFLSQFKVSFPIEFGKTAQVKIVDMSGNVQFNKASVIDGEQIDLANFNSGNYILHLTSNDNMNSKSIKISKIQ